jgi:uncharacterized membrane protein HdeD (DUF308 family)
MVGLSGGDSLIFRKLRGSVESNLGGNFMLHLLARRWWALALRGLLAVIFGLLTFFVPGITLFALVLLFGFYAILDGVFDIISAIRAPGAHWPLLVEGIIGVIAGILAILWPGITAMFFST